MDVIKKCIPGLLILFSLAAPGRCFAQISPAAQSTRRPMFYFDKPVTLDSLTKYVHSRSKIRFSFNSSKVKGDKMIYLKKGTYSTEQLLQQIRKNTSLYYSMFNGYVIFQDNPPKPKPQADVKKSTPKPPVRKSAPVVRKAVTPAPKDTSKPVMAIAAAGPVIDTSKPAAPPVVTPPVVTPPPVKKKPAANTNTAQNKSTNADDDNAGSIWQFGLQWKGAIPLYGFKDYFTGPNNRSQPYNLLIPGAWVSATFNAKHEVLLLVKPAEWYLYDRSKEFRSFVGYDTSLFLKSTRLQKTGGVYASLQYNFHINNNWMVGAGAGYYLRDKGLVYEQRVHAIGNRPMPDTLYSLQNDSIATKYLKKSMITAKVEVAYSFGAIDVGSTIQLPLTDPFTSQSKDHSKPLSVQLFVRWRIKRAEE